MLRFGLALLLVANLGGGAHAASGKVDVGGADVDEAEGGVAKKASAGKARSASTGRRSARKKVAGNVVPDSKLRQTPAPRPSGNLRLYALAADEDLKVNIYNEDGSYDVNALQAVSRLLRCKRTDAIKDIEPRLVTILSHVYDHFGGRRLEIVSGFRNQRRTTSFHFQGAASDIRIAGVTPKKVRAFVESLDEGGMGIGLYPRSGFVHVDVRPLPSYRWIDYSRSNPDSSDKRPPRGWKRKKLQS